ncbi:DUF1266 domain-containing protein [Streptomyces nymphaeiformis]|uniref:DUF1266 domain-containing protein n=1 Tax=Streptomyces nymphaeiformis TaxID=2663842 RepID=UPI0028AF14A5|nr:DUF1266 domain-containing protein [Streptomyces nymphaeiformis]
MCGGGHRATADPRWRDAGSRHLALPPRRRVDGVHRLIGRITRYEARFRADGLLPEGAYVHSTEAWDYGRASAMARWGLAAGYCTFPESEAAIIRAGRLVRTNYRSWAEFSGSLPPLRRGGVRRVRRPAARRHRPGRRPHRHAPRRRAQHPAPQTGRETAAPPGRHLKKAPEPLGFRALRVASSDRAEAAELMRSAREQGGEDVRAQLPGK